jgi:hypothetical protein
MGNNKFSLVLAKITTIAKITKIGVLGKYLLFISLHGPQSN